MQCARNGRLEIIVRLSRGSIRWIIPARFGPGGLRLAESNPPRALRLLARAFGRGGREATLVGLAAAALFLAIAISSYHRGDPSWSVRNGSEHVVNRGGVVGAWVSDVLLQLFGHVAWLLPALLTVAGVLLFIDRDRQSGRLVQATRGIGFVMVLAAACGVAALHYGDAGTLPEGAGAGGILGAIVGDALFIAFSFQGATVVMLGVLLAGWAMFTRVSWLTVMETTGRLVLSLFASIAGRSGRRRERREISQAREERVQKVEAKTRRTPKRRRPPRIEPVLTDIQPSPRAEQERQTVLFERPGPRLPELAHLDQPSERPPAMSEAALETMSRQVEVKLRDFGIDVEVVAVHPGPVITRFELEPSPGLKVSRVTALAKDLARSLSTVSVRIVEIIPGKSVIGLEVPNEEVELVYLSEILGSADYERSTSPVTLGLGKDIAGQPVVVDLARMPHLLVAGTTGSGKSVALNAMILSLLYKASPEQVRLIMVDPKMLELSVYDGIPHLLAPVVTDMKDAANAFRWCIGEMERRYRVMSALGVRNLAGFNRKVAEAVKGRRAHSRSDGGSGGGRGRAADRADAPHRGGGGRARRPDDGGRKEDRAAHRPAGPEGAGVGHSSPPRDPAALGGRDYGTHQGERPQPDRVPGLVADRFEGPFSTRAARSSSSDTATCFISRRECRRRPRVHGAFVSDQEVHRVVDDLKSGAEPDYVDGVLDGGEWSGGAGAGEAEADGGEADPLYDEAVRMVTESRRASISGVQRRLKIGYNRAARMVERMEAAGVVGPVQSNGSREVLAAPPPE